MDLSEITPLILTYNEEVNIARTLRSLKWAQHVVAIDSDSTDATAQVIREYPRVRYFRRSFDSHAEQWNFGLEQIATRWVLALDADYVCPEELAEELRRLEPCKDAYAANFGYCVFGWPLRRSLYPPRIILFRADRYRYRQDGHTQSLDVCGGFGTLNSVIVHDDRKPLSRWLESQSKYADLEVEKLLNSPAADLGWKDHLRKRIVWAPVLTVVYCLFHKGLILDGWPGIFYTLQRVYAELLLSIKLLERKLESRRRVTESETLRQESRGVERQGSSHVEELSSKGGI